MVNKKRHSELQSFAAAWRGLKYVFANETHAKVHFIIMLLVIFAGWYFLISSTEWLLLCITFVLVIGAEIMNTAIEKLCDVVHPDYHKSIGLAKDIAAGAVLFAAIVAIVIGCIIFLPKIF
jgi:diacylglycerol kinase